MHDCRTNGGHFFVHRPQGHAFRCRRCSERFANSWSSTSTPTSASASAPRRKHPWRCLIERCEYVACDPCSSILMEELASDREEVEGKVVEVGKVVGEGEKEEKMGEEAGMEVMEVDDEEEGEGGYEVPAMVSCRTARQAAAEAAIKRANVKRAPVRHGGRGSSVVCLVGVGRGRGGGGE
ncbi:uncharacterized protein LAJ45_10959 [Morchella importuna]|uniref:uncharacterized protein n=1 Tax=Morchella importuna TaxID=1174673 RepID=UPI001E8D3324|nr:uncharacterized protein LAJ45_10959 [Morchella importuna]KAH8145048.1 hypothetical protein LAJ45_10959 [Morchella importuna]